MSVHTLTLSTAADKDFRHPDLPAQMSQALRSPLVNVAPGVDAARATALTTTQEPTLSMATAREAELPARPLTSVDMMDVNTLFGFSDPDRAAWYVHWLAPFQAQLAESAAAHRLPIQLLAVVVLNELADIDRSDVTQSIPIVISGSLGIAQIQVSTARSNRLIDLPPYAYREGWMHSGGREPGNLNLAEYKDMGLNMRIAQLLQVPQVAIEAAAREVERLIVEMAANHGKPWQLRNNFVALGPSGTAIYTHVGSGSDMDREGTLAEAICGAYNSPRIVTATDTSAFDNASIHGANAKDLAQDLYRFRLFHP